MGVLRRRLLTIPGYTLAWVVWLCATPIWLPLAVLIDSMRRARGVALRGAALMTVYLSCEVAGIALLFGVWVWRAVGWIEEDRWIELHYRLQAGWGTILHNAMVRLFALRLEIDDDADLARGPYLLLVRHTGSADTLLAAPLVSQRFGTRLRYVIKQERLWDPCLDIAGNRLPNVFVDRFSSDSAREVERIRESARDLGPRDGVLIYPEGTRFSKTKRKVLLDRFTHDGDAKMLHYAESLPFVLPPRTGGVLALLEAAPDADVVVCVHTGFEVTASLARVWAGELVGRRIRIRFYRIARREIPTEATAQGDWLREAWRSVDAWVASHLNP
jgi:1-acyl-sn-glycerol-3-phosphate acyltransferase